MFVTKIMQLLVSYKLFNFKFLLSLGLSLWLTGCVGVNVELGTDVTFYEDEKWEATTSFKFPPQMKTLMELAEAQKPGDFETTLGQMENELEAQGIEATVTNEYLADDSLLVTIKGKGQGLATLQGLAFNPEAELSAETVDGQRHINLRYTPETQMRGMVVTTNTIRLTGGEIIQSNADRVEGGTAIWNNPSQIEATLTESSAFSIWSIMGSVIICIGLGLGAVFVGGGVVGGIYWYRQKARASVRTI